MDKTPTAPPSYEEATNEDIPKIHGNISQLDASALGQGTSGSQNSALPDHLSFLPVTDPKNPLSAMIDANEDKGMTPEAKEPRAKTTKPKPAPQPTYITSQPRSYTGHSNCCHHCHGHGCEQCRQEEMEAECAECLCQCMCILFLALLKGALGGK